MNSVFKRHIFLLILLCFIIFFFGNQIIPLTDPDEVFYWLTTKEMVQHQNWFTPYIFHHPQFEKPIFTYLVLKLSYLLFGDNPFSARFFPAFFASLGVLAVYFLGLLGLKNSSKAFLGAFIIATSAFYIGMGKTVFTDMIFTVFILLTLLSFYWSYSDGSKKSVGIYLFFTFAALATLTKGPLGLIIPILVIILFFAYTKQMTLLKNKYMAIGFLIYLSIALPWYIYSYINYGDYFINEFFYNDHWRRLIEAEHVSNDKWFFYPITMIAGLFPWSLFLVGAFVDIFKRMKYRLNIFEYFLLSWIMVVFFVFQVAHSKLASYILPMFSALALLTANYINNKFEEGKIKILKVLSVISVMFLFLLGVGVVVGFNFYKKYVPTIMPGYFLSGSLITLSSICLVLLLQERIRVALFILGFALIPIFFTAYLISADIEPEISMHHATSYLPTNLSPNDVILVSKPFARGVKYYTGHNVAVMNINGQNYFSPHPIRILTSDDKLIEFLKVQKQTFAILRKSQFKHLSSGVFNIFKIDTIIKSGQNFVVKITSKENV